MTYFVALNNGGYRWFLRSTTWTSEMDRATKFDTPELAQAGLDKARQFMKASIWKKAEIFPYIA